GGRIARGWTLDAAEGNLESRFGVVGTDWECHFQQNMFLVPVGLHLDVYARHAGVHRYVLMNDEFWKCFFTRTMARSGPLSTSSTESALSKSQCCFSKSASMFQASHCFGLS